MPEEQDFKKKRPWENGTENIPDERDLQRLAPPKNGKHAHEPDFELLATPMSGNSIDKQSPFARDMVTK